MDSPQKILAELSNIKYAIKIYDEVIQSQCEFLANGVEVNTKHGHIKDAEKEKYALEKLQYYHSKLHELIDKYKPKNDEPIK